MPHPHAKLGPGMILITKDETHHIDNGERMITVIVKFGPYWDDDEESA